MDTENAEAVNSRISRLANRVTLSNALAVLSLFVAVAAVYYTRDQAQMAAEANRISKEANDRAAGRVGANLEIVGMTNPDTAPAALRVDVGDGGQVLAIRYRTVDDLLEYNPCVFVKNAGPDPIDTIRVQVTTDRQFMDLLGLPLHRDLVRGKALLRQIETQEFPLHSKLLPKHEIGLPISRCLLGQMLQVDGKIDQTAYAIFNIRLSAKIAGGSTFDPIENGRMLYASFAWSIGGFPAEKCKAVMAEFQPRFVMPPPKLDK
ncbi:unnamed protein product [Gemmataceae bacterium]|jgi:hypothetical protein|nr:unnamed protein product [Gemmataceae bacterium]VTT97945.1 unnamed protein product [Gemmataceae bacterium]